MIKKIKEISFINYSPNEHKQYLDKWLADPELMRDWGMKPFSVDQIDPWTQDPTRVILMIKDNNSGDIIGFVNFYNWNKERCVASRGTLIDPKFQNQGFGKAAILESNKYGFENLGLKRIELYVGVDNERSRHITEKLGYVFDRFDSNKNRYYYYIKNPNL